jgi:flagellar motor switch protein FliN
MSISRQDVFNRFVDNLATVIGALVDANVSRQPETGEPEGGWVVALQAEQSVRGTLSVEFDRDAIEALTKRVMGMETEPSPEVVIDTLKEICAQAAGSMVQEPPLTGARFTIASVDRAGVKTPDDPALMQVAVGEIATLRIRIWGDLALPVAPQPSLQQPASAASAPAGSSPAAANPKLDVILDIDLPLLVRFGRTEMPLRSLTTLGPGSVIDLGRSPDDPVDVLVSNQVVARGEVVIVGGNYGVRILDVMSPADRMRSMEVEW